MTTALATTKRLDLADGSGANTQFAVSPSVYAKGTTPNPVVVQAIIDLGVGCVREGWRPSSAAQRAAFTTLTKADVRLVLYIGDITSTAKQVQADIAALAASPFAASVVAICGPDEPNAAGGEAWPVKAVAIQQTIWNEVHKYRVFAHTAIVGPGLKHDVPDIDADYQALADAGIARWCNAGDFHYFPGSAGPVTNAAEADRAGQAYSSLSLWQSETGWTTSVTDATTAGLFSVEALLRNHLSGIVGTLLYDVADEAPYVKGALGEFGLMTATTPKPAYTGIQTLLRTPDGKARFPGWLDDYSPGLESDTAAVVTSDGSGQWTVYLLREKQTTAHLVLPARFTADCGDFTVDAHGNHSYQVPLGSMSVVKVRAAMFLGAAHYPATEDAFKTLEGLVGRMGVRRTYNTGANIPATFASTAAATDVGKRASWLSVRSPWASTANGDSDDAITAFANSIPQTHTALVTWCHEPENDGGVPADFVAGYRQFYRVFKAARPDIPVGPIYIGWTFDPANHGNDRANYADAIGANYMDFAGIDPYNKYHFPPAGNGDVWTEAAIPQFTTFLAWCDSIGVQPGLGETACAVDTTHGGGVQRKIDWINTMVARADKEGCIAFCYFDTLVNNDVDPSALIEAQQETIDAWSIQVGKHHRAT